MNWPLYICRVASTLGPSLPWSIATWNWGGVEMQRYIVAKFAPVPLNTHKQVGSMTTIQQLSTIDQTMFAQKVRRMFVFQRLRKWTYWLGSDEIEKKKKTTLEEETSHIFHMHSVCSLILGKKWWKHISISVDSTWNMDLSQCRSTSLRSTSSPVSPFQQRNKS